MRTKLTWILILTVIFVCVATGCHTADRWAQCDARATPSNSEGRS